MICAAAAAAIVAVHVRLGSPSQNPVWFLYSGTAETAGIFLADLLSSMITMATLAVSITMVVLTLAAQQLGPRLIRNFIGDLRTQIFLGLFVYLSSIVAIGFPGPAPCIAAASAARGKCRKTRHSGT